MRPITSRSASATQIVTGTPWLIASSMASSTTSSTRSIGSPGVGVAGPDEGQRAGAGHPPALLGVALRHDEALGPVLGERLEGAGQPGDPAPAGGGRLLQASRRWPRRAPAPPRPPPPRRRPAPRRRRTDADGDPAAEPLAQVRVEPGLELAGDGVGRADGEVVEAARLPQVEGGPRRVAEVLVGQLLAVVGGGAALALAAAVVVARELVDELGAVDQPAELEHVELRPLPVGQQHADRLVLLHHRLELTDRRRVVDHQARAHRLRELDHLPEVRGRAGEDRQPTRLVAVEAALHERLDASEVVVHRPVAVGPACGRRAARRRARARRPGDASIADRRRRGNRR